MDVTEGTPERFRIGIEGFLAGDPLIYHGVVFQKDPRESRSPLFIASYSECVRLENTTPEEARVMIERSKHIFEALKELSAEFASVVRASSHRFEFCMNSGGGAFVVATSEGGRFTWLAGT